eukprot:3366454-Ditylum_brightwellii.AAC.3
MTKELTSSHRHSLVQSIHAVRQILGSMGQPPVYQVDQTRPTTGRVEDKDTIYGKAILLCGLIQYNLCALQWALP